ncbi:MAG: alpha/beta hydrolase [Actinobacteria bacterium HGW-Actinobacteria-4]|nr:MAG: alpha/beta hydrolase [Actinobacteria bacterium HGW-Actinobacteria-4]
MTLADGRTLEYYDARRKDSDLVVVYHHGTPNIGEPPLPVLEASAARGISWVSFSRPGYANSTRVKGRAVSHVAEDVAQVTDALGVERFAVLGHSGGGPHALACAALLPDRVSAVVSIAGLAPLLVDGFEREGDAWFEGMYAGGKLELKAAVAGAKALRALLSEVEWDPDMFTAGDVEAFGGPWGWLHHVVEMANAGGVSGMIDDNLAFVHPWGFELADVAAPTLLMHGDRDRIVPVRHSEWIAERLPDVEVWREEEHSHISVLMRAEDALDWIVAHR